MTDKREHITMGELREINERRLQEKKVDASRESAEAAQWEKRIEKLGPSTWWKRLKCKIGFCRWTADVDQDIKMTPELHALANIDGVEGFKIYATMYCSCCLTESERSEEWKNG